jgi:hypothetical protein
VKNDRHDYIISEDKLISVNSDNARLPRATETETDPLVKVDNSISDDFLLTPGDTTDTIHGDATADTTHGDSTTTTINTTGMYKENAIVDIGVVEFAEASGEINAAEEEIDVYVAMDSGAIGHIAPKEAMPSGVDLHVGPNGVNRDLVAANGGAIVNHGNAEVELVTEDNQSLGCTFMVADVTRPLHATGVICDTGKEVLHTARGAVVVPAGSLSKHVTKNMVMAKYPRKGGLYLARYRVRAPKRVGTARPAGFTRQGPKR